MGRSTLTIMMETPGGRRLILLHEEASARLAAKARSLGVDIMFDYSRAPAAGAASASGVEFRGEMWSG